MFSRVKHFWWRVKARRLFGQRIEVFGDFTVDNPGNVRFGTGCAINAGVHLVGRCGIDIGDNVVLSAHCMLVDAGLDPLSGSEAEPRVHVDGPIKIGSGAWICAGAIVLPGVTIGERAIVGAGSVVTTDVPPGVTVAGNPARPISR